jgi:hypothetical protein
VALSDDQKALLRLLAQREQGYEDIGALMGLSVDQVRARVREALAELSESGAPAAAAPAPKAAEPPPPPPPAPSAPEPEPRRAPAPPSRAVPRPAARPAAVSLPRPPLPKSRRGRFELIGGIVVVVLLVLFATGAVDIGGGGGGSKSSTATTATPPAEAGSGSSKLTQALLKPVAGGKAIGRALFGRVGGNVVLQVVAKGLEPSPPGRSYTVWLVRSPKLVLRVGAVKVGRPGGIAARFPVPTELLAYVASGAFKQIDVSLVSDAAYRAEVARAKGERRLPPYAGETILRGEITGPIVKK